MKRGVPPTALNARTGEFTPPGITRRASSNRVSLRSVLGFMGWHREALQVFAFGGRGLVGVVGRVVARALRPEQAIGQQVAHAGAKAAVERLVEVAQRLAGGRGQVAAGRDQRGQRGGKRVARATELGVEALEF